MGNGRPGSVGLHRGWGRLRRRAGSAVYRVGGLPAPSIPPSVQIPYYRLHTGIGSASPISFSKSVT